MIHPAPGAVILQIQDDRWFLGMFFFVGCQIFCLSSQRHPGNFPQIALHHPGVILDLRWLPDLQNMILVSCLLELAPLQIKCLLSSQRFSAIILLFGRDQPGIILSSCLCVAIIPVSSCSWPLHRKQTQHFAKKLPREGHHPIEIWLTRMNHPSSHLQACAEVKNIKYY